MHEIEKEWRAHGLRCRVVMSLVDGTVKSHRCGYVGVTSESPLFEMGYNDVSDLQIEDAHGGLTFADYMDEKKDIWWVGFDCMHYGDSKSFAAIVYENSTPDGWVRVAEPGVFRSLEYVTAEAERLADNVSAYIGAET